MPNEHPTALSSALIKAGYRVADGDTRPGEHSAAKFTDTTTMSDGELEAEFLELKVNIAHISAQLSDDKDDGFERSSDWRARAKGARRIKQSRFIQVEAEARKRGLAFAIPKLAEKLAIQAANEAREKAIHEAAERRRRERESELERELEEKQAKRAASAAQKEAKRQTEAQQNLRRCQMFVKAAYRMLSGDEFARVWKYAEEMFPNDPAWLEESPDLDQRLGPADLSGGSSAEDM